MSDLLQIVRQLETRIAHTAQALGGRFMLDESQVRAAAAHSETTDAGAVRQAGASGPATVQPGSKPEHKDRDSMARKSANDSIDPQWPAAPTLDVLYTGIRDCTQCTLAETRTNFVFGVGNPNAEIMVIGEAPGADEDARGEPFVGRAGQLLNKILEAIDFKREDVYIANIIKCRPPANRRPEADEVEKCEPFLFKQIDLIQPKFILSLGLTSVNTLLKARYKMGDIRGKQLEFRGATLIATYHPAALLRNPGWKRQTWDDVQLLRRLYDEAMK